MKKLIALILLTVYVCAFPAFAQQQKTTITGIIYDVAGDPDASGSLTVYEIRKVGSINSVASLTFYTNASGQLLHSDNTIGIKLPRNSQARIYSNAPNLGYNKPGGVWVTIPDLATTTLEELVPLAAAPTGGLTLKDESVALPSLIGTIDFIGQQVTVAQTSSGKASVTVAPTPWGAITGTLSAQTDLQAALNAKAAFSHTHTLSQVTDAGTAASKNFPASGNAASGEVVLGNDTRLTDARTPSAHASTHAAAGSDPVTISESQVTNLISDLAGKVPAARAIATTAPLSGGGDLSANRTISIPKATSIVDGYLAAADFAIFAGKQDALTIGNVTGSNGVSVTGGTGAIIGSGLALSLSGVPNSALQNSTFTINGVSVALGGSTSVGTVTSIGLTAPSFFSVSGSPVTSSGTIALSLATQAANKVFAGPSTGADAAPTFRFLIPGDIPDLSATYQPLLGFTPVPNTRTVNGHALSSDVTVTKSDVGLGNVSNNLQLLAANNFSDVPNPATARANLGVAIGTDVQAFDADLSALAGLSSTGIVARSASNTFTLRALTGTANRLTVTNGNGVSGNPTLDIDTTLLPSPAGGDVGKFLKATAANAYTPTSIAISDVTSLQSTLDGKQDLDADLTAIAALSSTGIAVRTASNTWAQRSIAVGSNLSVADGNGVSGNPTISLGTNVVTSVVNDTNVTGSISSNALTLGWTGALAKARQHAATVYNDQTNTFGNFVQTFQAGNNFLLVDPSDTSKKAKFDLSNISASNTRTVNIANANSTTVQADTGASNQFLTAISAQGVISKAQPSFTNISGTAQTGQGGTGLTATPTNGQLPIGNGSGYTLATLTAGAGIDVTNGAGSVTISTTGEKLLATITLDVDTTALQALYTVPSGKTLVVTRAVVSNASADMSAYSGAFRLFETEGSTNFVNHDITNFFANGRLFRQIITGVSAGAANPVTVGAGFAIQAKVNVAYGSPATLRVDLFGYLY